MMRERKLLWQLFTTMLKIGLFTFGGGYAMIPLFEEELVMKNGWIERKEFVDLIAIAESTPGPIAINSATYIGYRLWGVWGSVVATVAICIPSFVIIYAISLFFDAFLTISYVGYAFRGIQVCVIYLIASAGFRMLKSVEKSWLTWVLFGGVLVAFLALTVLAVQFSSIFLILACAAAGLLVYGVKRMKVRGKKQ